MIGVIIAYCEERETVNSQIQRIENFIAECKKFFDNTAEQVFVDCRNCTEQDENAREAVYEAKSQLKTMRFYHGLTARRRYLTQIKQILYLLARKLLEIGAPYSPDFVQNVQRCIEVQERFRRLDLYLDLQTDGAYLKKYDIFCDYFNSEQVNALYAIALYLESCNRKAAAKTEGEDLGAKLATAQAAQRRLSEQLDAAKSDRDALEKQLANIRGLGLDSLCTDLCRVITDLQNTVRGDESSANFNGFMYIVDKFNSIHSDMVRISKEIHDPPRASSEQPAT